MQQGFVARTPRGRMATPKAWERVGLKPPISLQAGLFEEGYARDGFDEDPLR
jgi:holliday junction DNA helicase RuvB